MRIDFVRFGLAAVNGFHLKGMAQDEGNAFLSTQVGEPLPGEDAFHRHDQPLSIRGNRLEEGFRGGFHVAVQHGFAIVTQEANVHGTGM